MRIVFVGTGAIGVPVLRMLNASREHELAGIVTQPDKPVGRKQIVTPPPVKAEALTFRKAGRGISHSLSSQDSAAPLILQPLRIKNAEAIAQIRALAPDLVVVMAYGQILPRDVLEIPPRGCLNLHASLLPRWRGAAPIQAAIAAGDGETGITVMYMDEGLDTGDVLLQRTIAIAADETGSSLHDRLAELAPAALIDALSQLEKGIAPRLPQDKSLATYAPKLERADGRIDWSQPVEVIERKIRAYDPWPGAFTILGDRTLKIFRAQIAAAKENELTFKAADGFVSATEVQLEGARRMTAAEFLHGHSRLATSPSQ